jgi:hypothetical protein
MKRNIFIILTFILTHSLSVSFAQDEMDFRKADISTYNAYLQQRWKDLADTAEMAIEKGYDYYYMRMRAGIAYSEMKKYRKAIAHFKKALEFSTGDPAAVALLYLAYVRSGFHHQAAWLVANDSVKPPVVTVVNPEAGFSKNLSFANLKTEYLKPDPGINYFFEKDISGPFSYYSASVIHELSPRWQLNQSISFLTMEKFSQVQFDRNTFINPGHIILENQYTTNQYSWFINPIYFGDKSKQVSFYFNGFLINSDNVNYEVTGAALPPFTGQDKPEPVDYFVKTDSSITTLFELASGINLISNHTFFARNIHLSFYKGSNAFRFQAGYTATVFPWASPVFSSSTSVYGMLGNGAGLVFKQLFRFQPFPSLSAELHGIMGNMSYFADNNGSVVYNFSDVVRLKAGLTFQYFPLKKLGISGGYTFSQAETLIYWNRFNGFTNKGDVKFERSVELHKYTNHLIFGGIIWVL